MSFEKNFQNHCPDNLLLITQQKKKTQEKRKVSKPIYPKYFEIEISGESFHNQFFPNFQTIFEKDLIRFHRPYITEYHEMEAVKVQFIFGYDEKEFFDESK